MIDNTLRRQSRVGSREWPALISHSNFAHLHRLSRSQPSTANTALPMPLGERPAARAAAPLLQSADTGASTGAAAGALWPSRSDCLYTACYCEENVYLLAQALQPRLDAQLQDLFVVFVSNHGKLVPLWRQRAAAAAADAPVLWVRCCGFMPRNGGGSGGIPNPSP